MVLFTNFTCLLASGENNHPSGWMHSETLISQARHLMKDDRTGIQVSILVKVYVDIDIGDLSQSFSNP